MDLLSTDHEFSERHFSLHSNDRSIERRRVDFPFHLVAVAYRYGARRRTSNCYSAWASVLTLRFMGEPVENAKFDASTSFFFAMKKEKLLQLCKYYKGEEHCPETYTTAAARKLWRAEYMICNALSDMVESNPTARKFHPRGVCLCWKMGSLFSSWGDRSLLGAAKSTLIVTIVLFSALEKG